MAFKSLGMLCSCSGKPVIFQCLAEAGSSTRRGTNMHGRKLFVTNWIIPWCIPKLLPDRGITSTVCLVLSSVDCTALSSTTKPEIKANPKSRRFGSESGHQHCCSSKSPSQQEWKPRESPSPGMFRIHRPCFFLNALHQHLSCRAHDFLLKKNKNRIIFWVLRNSLDLTDGFFSGISF